MEQGADSRPAMALPNCSDVVFGNCLIGRYNRHAFMTRLGDEHPVEGIFMQHRQRGGDFLQRALKLQLPGPMFDDGLARVEIRSSSEKVQMSTLVSSNSGSSTPSPRSLLLERQSHRPFSAYL